MKRRQFLICLSAAMPIGRSQSSGDTLYMLTYDHCGAIGWGIDHFTKYLRTAAEWMDRYPSFKIGLDNEAYTYDYMAEQDPKLLRGTARDGRPLPGAVSASVPAPMGSRS